jgi:GGDEF domain-containing protein
MGRLEQELARAQRQKVPLGLVIGQVRDRPGGEGEDAAARCRLVERITKGKRRSDVAGQYGPSGFLLLLPDTAEGGAATCCRRLEGLLRQGEGGPGWAPPHVDFGFSAYPVAGGVAGLLCRAEERLEQAQGAGDTRGKARRSC